MKLFNHILIILNFLLFCSISKTFSQVTDQPNIDFEFGNTDIWKFYIGACCPISTPTNTPALPDRHTITSGSSVDPYGLFPVVCATCGIFTSDSVSNFNICTV